MATWNLLQSGVLALPSGRLVRGRKLRDDDGAADFTVFLTGKAVEVDRPSAWIRWPDFWLPLDRKEVRRVLLGVLERSDSERVEFVCRGGRGRTGTALACLAVLDGVPATEAVGYVRKRYDPKAVETPWQRRYVEKFGSWHRPPE